MSYREYSRRHFNFRQAKHIHSRSSMARQVDERLKAPTASSFEQWQAQPNRYDLPNVDTPKRKTT